MPINVEVGAIANAIVWPTLIGILLIWYRRSIAEFLKDLAPKISKFSAGPISVDLNNATGIEPKWTGPGPMDLRQTGLMDVGGSARSELLDQI